MSITEYSDQEQPPTQGNGLVFASFIIYLVSIGIIGCVALTSLVGGFLHPFIALIAPFSLVPLAWMIPMTVINWKIYKGKSQNSVAFGVCTLLFVNVVSGILLLCAPRVNSS
jgi:hypothetical protein